MSTDNRVALELCDGIAAAIDRLQRTRTRRTIQVVALKNEIDGNESGWSGEEPVREDPGAPILPIPEADFFQLFEAISDIPTLTQLNIHYYVHPIPVRALSLPFRNECRVESIGALFLRHVNLVGTAQEFQELGEVLAKQHGLVTAGIASCKTTLLGPFINAIAAIRSLQALTLEEMPVSGDSLATVCHLPNLQKLKLCHIPASNEAMSTMAAVLAENTTLRDLRIRYALDKQAVTSFFQMLEGNDSLQIVEVDLDCWDQYSQPIASALKLNNTLCSLDLNIYGADKCVAINAKTIAEALEDNSCLSRLSMTFTNRMVRVEEGQDQQIHDMTYVRECFMGPFEELLETNFVLEELLLGPVHERFVLSKKVEFYLKLNRAGRHRLMDETSRQKWIETLICHRQDLNVLFYFLSCNPSILEKSRTESPTTGTASESVTTTSSNEGPPDQQRPPKRAKRGQT